MKLDVAKGAIPSADTRFHGQLLCASLIGLVNQLLPPLLYCFSIFRIRVGTHPPVGNLTDFLLAITEQIDKFFVRKLNDVQRSTSHNHSHWAVPHHLAVEFFAAAKLFLNAPAILNLKL